MDARRGKAADAEGKASGETATTDGTAAAQQPQLTEQEILEQLDPAARAARLQQEKQRREHEAAIEARLKENETNVRQPPSLFSKRTAFDIRFDQIEEKPWERNLAPGQQPSNEHLAEFFNYGLSEEDWLEYSQQQLLIRQELVDAHHQKRPPDPAIVPIQAPVKNEADDATAVEAKPQAEAEEEVVGGDEECGYGRRRRRHRGQGGCDSGNGNDGSFFETRVRINRRNENCVGQYGSSTATRRRQCSRQFGRRVGCRRGTGIGTRQTDGRTATAARRPERQQSSPLVVTRLAPRFLGRSHDCHHEFVRGQCLWRRRWLCEL